MDSPIRQFLKGFATSWFAGMSGGLSVPLAVAAFYVPNDTAKILLGCTAYVCLVVASYWVWKKERDQRVLLQITKPRLDGEIVQVITGMGIDDRPICHLNLFIFNTGEPSIIRYDWAASVSIGETKYRGILETMPSEQQLPFADGRPTIVISSSQGIYEHAANQPIQKGSAISGWLRVKFSDLSYQTLNDSISPNWEVGFRDVTGEQVVIHGTATDRLQAPKHVPDGRGGIKVVGN